MARKVSWFCTRTGRGMGAHEPNSVSDCQMRMATHSAAAFPSSSRSIQKIEAYHGTPPTPGRFPGGDL